MSYNQREFITGKYYHVFNKTADNKTPFLDNTKCSMFLLTSYYYRASDLKTSFSKWKQFNNSQKNKIKEQLQNSNNFRVDIISYCLMPNHFHFVLKQISDHGIHDFISNVTNSFKRAYNIENNRLGALFLHRFHDVPIISSEQLLTVSRYVHRNPIAHKVNFSESFRSYPWSSYKDYLEISPDPLNLTNTKPVLSYFNSSKSYQKFVEDDFIYDE